MNEEWRVWWPLMRISGKNFRWAIEFFKINTLEELKKLFKESKIKIILESAKEGNLELFTEKFQIKEPRILRNLLKNPKLEEFLSLPEKNFQWAIKFFKIDNLKEFEKFCEKEEVINLLKHPPEIIEFVVDKYL
jgi:hypothetical protein